MKKALVLGAGGFIGSHLVKRLKKDGWWVRGVDLHMPEWSPSPADEFIVGTLHSKAICEKAFDQQFDRVYQLAADMGGAGFVFSGENDADIMQNSGRINLNVAEHALRSGAKLVFFSSSACVYPHENRPDPNNPNYKEGSAYPADPANEYGWEKLFSERLYFAYAHNKGLNIRIARFHTTYGPEGAWEGGREKYPSALCRKIAQVEEDGSVEIWGDGEQTRSFTYIDDCIEGIERLVASKFSGPVNVGSDEMTTINNLARMMMEISGKKFTLKHVPGPQGPRGRNSDNALIQEKLGWAPSITLRDGMQKTYEWVRGEVEKKSADATA